MSRWRVGKKDDFKHLSMIQIHKSSKERYLLMGVGGG